MTSEQTAVYEQVEFDLRSSLAALSQDCMTGVPRIREVRELVNGAHDIIESVFVEGTAGPEQGDRVIERILRKIAKESG